MELREVLYVDTRVNQYDILRKMQNCSLQELNEAAKRINLASKNTKHT